jgi:hypothetical protein
MMSNPDKAIPNVMPIPMPISIISISPFSVVACPKVSLQSAKAIPQPEGP